MVKVMDYAWEAEGALPFPSPACCGCACCASRCEEVASVRRRTAGTLTGSRTAVAVCRVPVAAALQATAAARRAHAWTLTDGACIGCASWADSRVTMARSEWAADRQLEVIESELQPRWNLRFKPNSNNV